MKVVVDPQLDKANQTLFSIFITKYKFVTNAFISEWEYIQILRIVLVHDNLDIFYDTNQTNISERNRERERKESFGHVTLFLIGYTYKKYYQECIY